mgnify:CR=1 FL=1
MAYYSGHASIGTVATHIDGVLNEFAGNPYRLFIHNNDNTDAVYLGGSGVTTSTSGWTQSGPTTPTFFEVGSNLYDLQLRNRITKYEGATGAGLVGKFLSGTTNGFVLANISSIVGVDTYVTGFTYSNNVATIKQNQGQSDLPVQFTTVSGLTVSNLTPGRVVYVGTGGLLSDDTGFTYDAATNTFSVPTDGTVNVGTGGLNVAGSAVIQGSLTVFGPSVSAFTSQLYVEDDNITLNYNPTGSTTVTSIGAGWTIQDGSGIANTATTLSIGSSYLNGNLSPNTEYTASTGNENRNLFSQVGDIIIRNTNYSSSAPNGVRVLTENDILDGGSY